MSLDRATTLAFAGRLEVAERALGVRDDPDARWLRAYLACARGEHARARAIARPLAQRAGDAGLRHRAALTLASALRQSGRHAEAAGHDRAALRRAPDAAARAHALIGLAADEVGQGRARACGRFLDRAAALAPRGDHRVWIRLWWVRAELALLLDRPAAAASAARRALARARADGARRHEAKSLLFLGVALRARGDRAAGPALARAERLAGSVGAAGIERVARDVRTAGGG